MTQIYKPKALIRGDKLGHNPNTMWVAVPDKFAGKHLIVEYGGAQMTIKNWRMEAKLFKRFRDKFWREGSNRPQYYTLGYFRFAPDVREEKS